MKKSAVIPPPSLMTRCQHILRSSAAISLPMLLIFAVLLAFMTRAMIGWSALRNHGQIADATVFRNTPTSRWRSARGSSAATNVYNYSFSYRGVRYYGVSAFNELYLGEWPHAPYRVAFLPESPQINDILPVGRWYVLQKSVEPGFALLVFAAMMLLSFTMTDEKKETRSGIEIRRPAKKGKARSSTYRRRHPRSSGRSAK